MLPLSVFTSTALYFSAFYTGAGSLLLLALYFFRWKSDIVSLLLWLLAGCVSAALSCFITGHSLGATFGLGLTLLVSACFLPLRKYYSLFGVFFFVSIFILSFFGLLAFFEVLISFKTGWLAWGMGILFAIFASILNFINSRAYLAKFSSLYLPYLPRTKINSFKKKDEPWVSIHVPCYDEPPEIVIETLDALSRLDYTHFEVLVFDNNTKDPARWKPVEAHCNKLGKRFRFYHEDHLKGYKAGALNKMLELTPYYFKLVAVVNADFVVEPFFLKNCVVFFKDPVLGYVQTYHDFRGFEKSIFKTACYYEYETVFKLAVVGYAESSVPPCWGTMCIFRAKALSFAGKWSEEHIVEDINIRSRILQGFNGYLLKETCGRGVIPDTFDAYKIQRIRWLVGSTQQYAEFLSLFLSNKTHFLSLRDIFELIMGFRFFFNLGFLILSLCVIIFFTWTFGDNAKENLIPPSLLTFIFIIYVNDLLWAVIQSKLLGGGIRESLLASIAKRSLYYTSLVTPIISLLGLGLIWKRPQKHDTHFSFRRFFYSCRSELILSLLFFAAASYVGHQARLWPPDIFFLMTIVLLNYACTFFSSVMMALFSEKDFIHKRQKN